MAQKQTIFLKVYMSGKLFVSKQFLSDQISIGSGEGPSLVLPSPSVSYWHALIEQRMGAYYISDLGSPTGTFVNSKPVLESPLKHGDQITIGDFVVHFYVGVPFVKKSPQNMTTAPSSPQNADAPAQPLSPSAESFQPPITDQASAFSTVPTINEIPDQFSQDSFPHQNVPSSSSEGETSPSSEDIPSFTPKNVSSVPFEAEGPPPPSKSMPSAPSPLQDMPQHTQQVPSQQFPLEDEPSSPPKKRVEAIPTHGRITAKPSVPSGGAVSPPPPRSVPSTPSVPSGGAVSPPPPRSVPSTPSVPSGGVASPPPPRSVPSEPSLSKNVSGSSSSVPFSISQGRSQSVPEETESVHPLHKEEIIPPSSTVSQTSSAVYSSQKDSVVSSQTARKPLETIESHLMEKTVDESKVRVHTSNVQNEDSSLDLEDIPSMGSVVEVVVAWKNRILSISHFNSIGKTVTFGSDTKADIVLPNLTGTDSYSLLEIDRQVFVYVSDSVKAKLLEKSKEYSFESLRDEHNKVVNRDSRSAIVLSQNQLIRLDFSPAIRVYIRYTNPVQKAALASFFDFHFSEMVGIMMSFVFLSGLFFYIYLFSPQFLEDDNKWEEGDLQRATIEFKRKQPRRVKLDLTKKTRTRKRIKSIPIKAKKTSLKKAGVNKPGKKMGRLGQVAPKPKAKSRKKTITSARSGGAVKTGKSGGSAKSPRPDPSKLGLLGVFGKKGTQTELDKAYSGTGELAGYAEEVTGYAGQKESYEGPGIGTEFKNVGAGGQGTNLIGVSGGIKTRGRGGGTRGYGTGGSLGSRGRVELRLGTDDWAVEGGIDKEAIRRVIRRHKAQLESCYEYALQKRPSLKGKVLLQWEIVGIKAKRVKVMSNSTGDRLLARCLMARLREWDFVGTGLKRGQIGVVNFPFAFHQRK